MEALERTEMIRGARAPGRAGRAPARPGLPAEPEPATDLCELRFLLPAGRGLEVAAWAAERLGEAAAPLAVETLYFDTPDWRVYCRAPGYRRTRYRARRYGEGSEAWLELRRRRGTGIREQRTAVPAWELPRLGSTLPDPAWEGEWFRARLQRLGLQPACRVRFTRTVFAGLADGGPVRLCLDGDLHAAPAAAPGFGPAAWGSLGESVLEFRFRHVLPRVFRDLLREFSLASRPRSKYRLAVDALGRARGR